MGLGINFERKYMEQKSYDADSLESREGGEGSVAPVEIDRRHPNGEIPDPMMQELKGEFADRHAGESPAKHIEANRDYSLGG